MSQFHWINKTWRSTRSEDQRWNVVIGELVDTISFWSVNDFNCTIDLNLKFLGHVSAFGSCQQLNEWMDEMIDE